MPDRVLVGAHLSTSDGLAAMVRHAVEIGAACIQMFTSSPQQWRNKRYDDGEAKAFLAARAETGVGPIISHESYLINLSSGDPDLLEKSRKACIDEIERCRLLQLPMVVLHWGAYKTETLDAGLARLAESLNQLIPLADDAGVRLVLETTAGQGTYLGGQFEQFARVFDMVTRQDRLGVCLDTCHVFAAGYDLRGREQYETLWRNFDRVIGMDRLLVIHVNDSQRSLGSHGDRHAHIGEGEIGLDAFRMLMQDPRLADVPKILETPGGLEMHEKNLRLLKELAAGRA